MTAVIELNPANRREGQPFAPEDRLKLLAWVIRRHIAYVGLALEIAGLESGKPANGLQSDVTYEKLRRARQKYEEAQGVLQVLVDIC